MKRSNSKSVNSRHFRGFVADRRGIPKTIDQTRKLMAQGIKAVRLQVDGYPVEAAKYAFGNENRHRKY